MGRMCELDGFTVCKNEGLGVLPWGHSMGKYIRVFGREGRRWVGVGVDVGNMTIYESGGFANIYLAKVVQKNALI